MALYWNQLDCELSGAPRSGRALREWCYKTDRVRAILAEERMTSAKLVTLDWGDRHGVRDGVTARAAFERLRTELRALGGELYHAQHNPRRRGPSPSTLSSTPSAPPVRVLRAEREGQNVVAPPKPVFTVEIELGEIDALFDPIGGGDPWTQVGVQQRLQALGYFYTPLAHPQAARNAQACWAYYKRVHRKDDDGEALALLRREVEGNLVAATLPGRGVVHGASALPPADGFAALRLPGGFACTHHTVSKLDPGNHFFNRSAPTAVPSRYRFGIGARRNEIEDAVYADNATLGCIPILARVMKKVGDAPAVPAAGVDVFFELADPDALPLNHALRAPDAPDAVMNYALEGTLWSSATYPGKARACNLEPDEWRGVHRLAQQAYARDPSTAEATASGWIETWKGYLEVPAQLVSGWWTPVPPGPCPRLENYDPQRAAARIDEIYAGNNVITGFGADVKKQKDALTKLVTEAKAVESDPALCKQLILEWITRWHGAPRVDWARVSAWWTAQGDQPYPALRATMNARAKEAVKAILDDRAAGESRVAEVTGGGPRSYIAKLQSDALAAADARDPQRFNAPHAPYGGKLGHADGIKAVLEVPSADRAGFHARRDVEHRDVGALGRAVVGARPHSVKCTTNDKGYVGVLFTPSRCGGDRYRLRATIDPDHLRVNGHLDSRGSAESGTLVVWRNLRFYRHVRLDTVPQDQWSTDVREMLDAAQNKPGSTEFRKMRLDTGVIDAAVLPSQAAEAEYAPHEGADYVNADPAIKMMYRPVRMRPNSFAQQLKWAWCELIGDSDAIEAMTDDHRRDITALAKQVFQRSGMVTVTVDWDRLAFFDATSPFMLSLRDYGHFNRIKTSGDDLVANTPGSDPGAAADWVYEAIAEYFADGGVLPGLTLIQMPRAAPWDYRCMGINTAITSGYGTAARACFLSHTGGVYRGQFAYPSTSNAIHELGHVLGLAHQQGLLTPFQTPDPSRHEAVCVMSYSGCYGDLCGRCLLSLRGWSHTHTPF